MMRHGVLLVGAGQETKTFWNDLKLIPSLVVEFLTFPAAANYPFYQNGRFPAASRIFLVRMIVEQSRSFSRKMSGRGRLSRRVGNFIIWTLIVSLFLKIYRQRAKDYFSDMKCAVFLLIFDMQVLETVKTNMRFLMLTHTLEEFWALPEPDEPLTLRTY